MALAAGRSVQTGEATLLRQILSTIGSSNSPRETGGSNAALSSCGGSSVCRGGILHVRRVEPRVSRGGGRCGEHRRPEQAGPSTLFGGQIRGSRGHCREGAGGGREGGRSQRRRHIGEREPLGGHLSGPGPLCGSGAAPEARAFRLRNRPGNKPSRYAQGREQSGGVVQGPRPLRRSPAALRAGSGGIDGRARPG